jgi:DNA invertase Pin-like site-specific DNA recombinase
MTPNKYINSINAIVDGNYSYLGCATLAEWDDSKPRSQQLREERQALFGGVSITQWQKDFYKPKREKEQPKYENIDMSFEAMQERHKQTLEFLDAFVPMHKKVLSEDVINEVCKLYRDGFGYRNIAMQLGLSDTRVRNVLIKNITDYKEIARTRNTKILHEQDIIDIARMYGNKRSIADICKVCRRGYAAVYKILSEHYPNFEQVANERFASNNRDVKILTNSDIEQIIKLYQDGETLKVIAKRFNKSRPTISKILRKHVTNYSQVANYRQGGSKKKAMLRKKSS